ncbi:hypothetical protein LIER_26303 [Lithospermum erythrorhizon]|uniref:Cation/H(+) antiporter C-terminal domain-containing protein n=1 Tax=Lithospermum erythrorhizon TaxID=34254 RepID=A0AAV3R7W0_LITER
MKITRLSKLEFPWLTIIRFLVEYNIPSEIVRVDSEGESSAKFIPDDNQFLSEVVNNRSRDSSVEYEERSVSNSDEVISIFLDHARCNLFLIGRSPGGELPLTLNQQRTDYLELGPVGNLLVSPHYQVHVVLYGIEIGNLMAPHYQVHVVTMEVEGLEIFRGSIYELCETFCSVLIHLHFLDGFTPF